MVAKVSDKSAIFVLIVFQLSLGISMINISTTVQSNAQNKIDKFNKLFNFDSTYLSRVITHDVNIANQCTRIIKIVDGKIN